MAWRQKAHRPVQLPVVISGNEIQHFSHSVAQKLLAGPPPGPLAEPIHGTLRGALAQQVVGMAQGASSDGAVVRAGITRASLRPGLNVTGRIRCSQFWSRLKQVAAYARNPEPRLVDATATVEGGHP